MPTWSDIRTFLKRDGWEKIEQSGRKHDLYRKILEDGTVLRTMVSRGNGELVHFGLRSGESSSNAQRSILTGSKAAADGVVQDVAYKDRAW